ncbi:hypothetical protein Vadar_022579 [Vaccinium darrowii]|uniref:Uncharacterized protein n=1 Tax=Vaccinium darrowii TaxID=229202 RepID=A0ACB7YHF0_9ERIC|nr:hypothetical protein Vadar_022579 [Vaccinium darrowii]
MGCCESALVDNLNWDTNSTNGINLGFVSGCEVDCIGTKPLLGPKDLGLKGKKEENVCDLDLHNGFRKPNSNLASYENSTWVRDNGSIPMISKQVLGSNHCGQNQEVVSETISVSERCCNGYPNKGLDLSYVPPSAGWSPPEHVPPHLFVSVNIINRQRFQGDMCELYMPKYLLNVKILQTMNINCDKRKMEEEESMMVNG